MITDEILAYEGKATPQEVVGYQQRVGSINYRAVITRPDISRAAQKLAEFLINTGPAHYAAADRVITYLKGTKYHSLVFGAPTKSGGGIHSYNRYKNGCQCGHTGPFYGL
ncbi:hypothetical protein V496_01935 [Pseudogymnoascus sp. VKM F-4515 (FW-2607)]|nr:hypothetical protein V496_01935 [Pseudogymnoascus sp. VKM F-4515 (FW-2607)]KFY90667.1 hypothetical protein V498_05862 [Pseudogymnoascus sp. VKM F-4517 (FW-2822)]